tara:strand:+ start:14351 stop:15508 length:1158 start_codon:yes stop_codon:yes gene_type:complete
MATITSLIKRRHAELSASGSATWLNCPGSRKANSGRKSMESEYALEGTRAHTVADKCLKKGLDANFFIDKLVYNEKVPIEMAHYVQEYLDYVRAHETKKTQLYTEERVDFSNIVPDGFGTMDAAVLDYDTGICHIFDLKYGQGIQVYSFENTQSQLYALGLLNELGFLDVIKTFRIHIVQPRKVTPTPWDISVEDLELFGRYAKQKAELAMTDDAPRVPGDKQCQWCDAKDSCGALAKFTEQVICADFEDLNNNTLNNEELTDSQRKTILDNKKLIENFLNAVETSIYNRIDEGGTFKGYKMVFGRSNRVWSEEAEKYLKRKLGAAQAYTKKIIGITAAEKLLGKGLLDQYMIKPPGKPTLAIESDSRAAIIKADVTDNFEKLEK